MCKLIKGLDMEVRTYQYENETYTTAEIAEKLGVNKKTMEKRLRLNNYDLSKCLTKPTNHNFKDISGEVFTRWTVLALDETSACKTAKWLCRCECGSEASVTGSTLRNGTSESCGCLVRDNNTVHGHARKRNNSRTYYTYKSMIQRCTNPEATGYSEYGGRGITICDKWLKSFDNFLEDMGERPSGRTLDREDNDKGYSKDNCRWATQSEQTQNSRQSRRWTLNGVTYNTAEEAGKELGVSKSVIRSRCNGYTDRGKSYPPKEGCFSELVYQGGV